MKKQQKANKNKQKTKPSLNSQPTTPAKPVELSDNELWQVVGGTQQFGTGGGAGITPDAISNVV